MKRIKTFKNFIKEQFNLDFSNIEQLNERVVSENKLKKAASLITNLLNKKTKYEFKLVDQVVNFKAGSYTPADVQGVMIYAENKIGVSVLIMGPMGNHPGLVGGISFFSDYANPIADLTMTSENFGIVDLIDEFSYLISDKKYLDEVTSLMESSKVDEGRRTVKFDSKTLKKIKSMLSQGIKVSEISRELNIPYHRINKVKQNTNIEELTSEEEELNEMTLNDRIKYLNEILEDIYEISRRIAAGAPNMNSLLISGRAGTGKSYWVEKAMNDEGLKMDVDYFTIGAGVSAFETYKKMFEFNGKVLIFDDADGIFKDQEGRNLLKGALDTRPERRISWLKKNSEVFSPLDFDEDDFIAMLDGGKYPNTFMYNGRIIFISNLPKNKIDPDGAIRSRSILIDVNPDDATLMERIKTLLPYLDPKQLSLNEKEEIYEFMKEANNVSMRTFVKAAGFKLAGLKNWKRMTQRYL